MYVNISHFNILMFSNRIYEGGGGGGGREREREKEGCICKMYRSYSYCTHILLASCLVEVFYSSTRAV